MIYRKLIEQMLDAMDQAKIIAGQRMIDAASENAREYLAAPEQSEPVAYRGEVTQEMIDAAEGVEELYKRGTPQTWATVYRKMCAAAPQPTKLTDGEITLMAHNDDIEEIQMTNTQLAPHQQRVVDELASLKEKVVDLRHFIFISPLFGSLDYAKQERLMRQNDLMLRYAAVLSERIAAF